VDRPPTEASRETDPQDLAVSLLERVRVRAHRRARAHYLAAKRTSRMHNLLGIPTVILTAVVGTSIFATLSASKDNRLSIAIGVISVISTILVSLQTFFRFGEQAEKHRGAGVSFSAIKRKMDVLKVRIATSGIDATDALAQVDDLIDKFNTLEADCLEIPDRVYDQARREQDADEEGI
jgi:hypothetical protein